MFPYLMKLSTLCYNYCINSKVQRSINCKVNQAAGPGAPGGPGGPGSPSLPSRPESLSGTDVY